MNNFTEQANIIFNKATEDYHVDNGVNTPINNPYEDNSISSLLYEKNWIDVVQ